MRLPTAIATASAAAPRDSPWLSGAAGSSRRSESTYQASSEPEMSARPAASSATDPAKAATLSAAAKTSRLTAVRAAPARSTRFRPTRSASAPLGTSSAIPTALWIAKTTPIAPSDRPRACGVITRNGSTRPTGSHRRARRTTKRRVSPSVFIKETFNAVWSRVHPGPRRYELRTTDRTPRDRRAVRRSRNPEAVRLVRRLRPPRDQGDHAQARAAAGQASRTRGGHGGNARRHAACARRADPARGLAHNGHDAHRHPEGP